MAGKSKNQAIQLSDTALNAFRKAKTCLAESTLLVHPNSEMSLCLMSDASNVAVGGALHQCINNTMTAYCFLFKAV